jgi:SEC-C motif domain protein
VTECPCGSQKSIDDCCGPIIEGMPAPTAEALMRSRYTAFTLKNLDYIEKTHASEIRKQYNRSAALSAINDANWLGLEVRNVVDGGEDDQIGTVEFLSNFLRDEQNFIHHELASFRKEDGNWVYVDGKMNPRSNPVTSEKIGRNEPCPCGSGKKYKKCCG